MNRISVPRRSCTAFGRLISRTAGLLLAVLVAPTPAMPALHAQRAAGRVTVNGIAFDSLRNQPLANAFIILTESSRSTTSDDKGRFRFDTVAPGTYTFAMQHAVFDDLGLSGATAKVTVTDGRTPVTLAVPSFATLWRAACGNNPVPSRDTGLVYGTVRDASTKRSVPQAWVEFTWLDLVKVDPAKRSTNVTQRRWKNEVQADAQGGYAVCGTPIGMGYTMRAFVGTNTTPSVTLVPTLDLVRRIDIVLGGSSAADATRRGTVRGAVIDSGGRPVREMRVAVGDVEARTDPEGRFTLRGVPTGTRQVDASAVGFNPVQGVVDVFADDTTQVTLTTWRVSALDTMRVRASANGRIRIAQFEERRRQGFGNYLDSLALAKRATLSAALMGMPGVTIQNQSANGRNFNIWLYGSGVGNCLANILLDGVQQTSSDIFNTLVPTDFAAVEVYPQRTTVPTELLRANQVCGTVAFWTKRAFR